MAKFKTYPTFDFTATITLNAAEAKAFDALIGYGPKGFLEVFKKHLGASYMEGNEAGLISLFESMRGPIAELLARMADAEAVFLGTKIARHPPAKVTTDA